MGSSVLLFLIILLYVRKWLEMDARQMVQDFREAFPDRCPICSYHR